MKAITFRKYGGPEALNLEEVEKPSPAENEVLIKVNSASLNKSDRYVINGEPFFLRFSTGLTKPKKIIPGSDMAGTVVETGKNVTDLKPGDEVYGDLSGSGFGAFAQYAVAPSDILALKPENISFETASSTPMAAVTALQGLRDHGKIGPGKKVIINGASGGVGSFAIQIAKTFGAEVTAVCSPSKTGKAKELGADYIIDYTKENFTEGEKLYDLVFAVGGYHRICHYKRVLTPAGRYVSAGGSMAQIFQAMLLGPLHSKKGGKQLKSMIAKPSKTDLEFLNTLFEEGKIKPVIEKVYSLNEMPDALRYLGEGHAAGKLVIKIEV